LVSVTCAASPDARTRRVCCAGAAAARCRPRRVRVPAQQGNGEYSFSYELSDGSARSEQAVLQAAGTPDEFLLVTGSFRWTSPDGQVTQVDYTADVNGYHPTVVQYKPPLAPSRTPPPPRLPPPAPRPVPRRGPLLGPLPAGQGESLNSYNPVQTLLPTLIG
ncbi:larval cuticle protein 65Ag1-like, partial [Thrips palmi]|uniref:Larval cuticle protein 65Ag1-like n=1 Tax=Thrips palmi TaxID=161013 RepID=A0A6P8YTR8_THRPL